MWTEQKADAVNLDLVPFYGTKVVYQVCETTEPPPKPVFAIKNDPKRKRS